jgi:hypothetical protein
LVSQEIGKHQKVNMEIERLENEMERDGELENII